MSNDWKWDSPDWRQPKDGSFDQGLGSYPTVPSSGSDSGGSYWDPVSLPPPPPTPPPFSGPQENPFGQPSAGSYPFAPSPAGQSRPGLWFLVPLIIFILVCAGGIGLAVYTYSAISSRVSVPPGVNGDSSEPVTIDTGPHPTIVINRNTGAVRIEAVADSKQVVIKPLETSSFSDGPIPYTKSNNGNTITFDLSDFEFVDVLLTVPVGSNLDITTNSDGITVTGVKGELRLSSNGGSLLATEVTLMGKSRLETNAGAITFSGTLDPQSVDDFSTNGEAITVTLPANAAFHVDISNNGDGGIQSQFSEVVVSGSEAHGDVGPAPRALVKIENNGGTIRLLKG